MQPRNNPAAPPKESVARLRETRTIGAAGSRRGWLRIHRARPSQDWESGKIADDEGRAESYGGAQAAEPVHLADSERRLAREPVEDWAKAVMVLNFRAGINGGNGGCR